MKKERNSLLIAVVAFLIFSGGYVLGYERSLPGGGILPNIINRPANKQVDFGLFWKSWDLLEKKYDGKLDYEKMLYGAISGMVQSVEDPYTTFMTPEESRAFENELSGTIYGIGAEIGIKKDRLTVISPIDGSPAERAGIKPGDLINKINEEETEGMSVDTAVSKIRGEDGTEVKLTIERDGQEKVYTIKRAKIEVKSVSYEIKDNILVISVSRFDTDTAGLIQQAENDGIANNVKGIILDLRNNPGGYLDAAVEVSSEFIKEGKVVIEKSTKGSNNKDYKASGRGKMTDTAKYPLIVLVNNGSASASEIVAGAIQDSKRGRLVGEKTFGKGSVQEIEKVEGDAQMKITVAHWFTPNGRDISKEGLVPDVAVEMTDADYNNNLDPQLDKAFELLK